MKEELKRYLNRYCINQRINYRSNIKDEHRCDIEKFCKRLNLLTSVYETSLDRKGHKFYTDALNARKTLLLPKGSFEASDGIYNYTIKVSGDESLFASIYKSGDGVFGSHITLFRDTEFVFEDDSREHYYYNKPLRKTLSAMVSVGGLTVHSKDIYSFITKLYIKPRNSFKEYALREISS